MTTQHDGQTQAQPSWPLPATQEAHAHLTWDEWTAQQATNSAHAQQQTPVFPATNQRSLVARLDRSLDRRTATRLTWPLPATQTPHARLAWAAWLEAQSRKPVAAQQDAAETVETAA